MSDETTATPETATPITPDAPAPDAGHVILTTPPTTTSGAAAGAWQPVPPSSYPPLATLADIETVRAEILANSAHPLMHDEAFWRHFAEKQHQLATGAPSAPPAPAPPVPAGEPTIYENPAQGVVADRALQTEIQQRARAVEGAPVVVDRFLRDVVDLRAQHPELDDSARARQVAERWPRLEDRQLLNERLDELYATLDVMLEDVGLSPEQRARSFAQLDALEARGVVGIEYLTGAFTQMLWDRLPAFAAANARVHGDAYEAEQAAIRRTPRPAAEDPERVVGHFGR